MKLKIGNLITFNKDEYPALGGWFVQIWNDDPGSRSEVVMRVYGPSPEETHRRAVEIALKMGGEL